MKKLIPFFLVILLLGGCADEDETPATEDKVVFSFFELNQNSQFFSPPNAPSGSEGFKTYMTPIYVGVGPDKKHRKVTINSLRINVLQYDFDSSELPVSLFFSNGGSISNGIVFTLNENSEIEITDSKMLDAIEKALSSGNYAEMEFKATVPAESEFEIRVNVVVNATVLHLPF